jgi:hypothetical protein
LTAQAANEGVPAPEGAEMLFGWTRGPITAGAAEIVSPYPWGFQRAGGSGIFEDDNRFNYTSLVYENGRLLFKGCTNVGEHAQSGKIVIRHPSRGNEYYFVGWAVRKYPIEDRAKGGRCERFDAEVMGALDVGEGEKASSFMHLGMSYRGGADEPTGSREITISGGR